MHMQWWIVVALHHVCACMATGVQQSLATHLCTPPPLHSADGGAPLFRAVGLRHPAGVSGRDGTFVPNDITLGGTEAPPFVVLTGGPLRCAVLW